MSGKTFVALLSGGLDSVVALAFAARESRPQLGLTFNYGQPAAAREMEAASKVAAYYRCEHRTVELGWYRQLLPAAFSAGDAAVPEPEEPGEESAAAVWVPGRNLAMIAIAAAWAEKLSAEKVVTGFNVEEAVTFPDNSVEFVAAANRALEFSSGGRVQVNAPLAGMTKAAIVKLGRELGAPLELVWSCYRGGTEPCGRCESCQRRGAAEAAMEEHG